MGVAATLAAAFAVGIAAAHAAAMPVRVVSLDYCADQYVLGLADRDQIAGVSTHADDRHSYLRDQAFGLTQVRDDAEDVLALAPDLIIRSSDGGGRASQLYQRLGLVTHELGYASDLDSVEQTIHAAADALGQPRRGAERVAAMRQGFASASEGPRFSALYITPSGFTAGGGTLMNGWMQAAGFDNVMAANGHMGWQSLRLEQLHLQSPDVILAAFFDGATAPPDSWSVARHSVFRRLMERAPVIYLDAAAISCGAWFMAEEALKARQEATAIFASEMADPESIQ